MLRPRGDTRLIGGADGCGILTAIDREGPGHEAGEQHARIAVRAARRDFQITSVPVRLGFADGRLTSHYRPLIDSLRIAKAVVGARFS